MKSFLFEFYKYVEFKWKNFHRIWSSSFWDIFDQSF